MAGALAEGGGALIAVAGPLARVAAVRGVVWEGIYWVCPASPAGAGRPPGGGGGGGVRGMDGGGVDGRCASVISQVSTMKSG